LPLQSVNLKLTCCPTGSPSLLRGGRANRKRLALWVTVSFSMSSAALKTSGFRNVRVRLAITMVTTAATAAAVITARTRAMEFMDARYVQSAGMDVTCRVLICATLNNARTGRRQPVPAALHSALRCNVCFPQKSPSSVSSYALGARGPFEGAHLQAGRLSN
jgi:hypothetical protein